MNSVPTRKDFRELLNRVFGVKDGGYRKGDRNQFGPRKRAYGDYLYAQDRGMFEFDYQNWLAGGLNYLNEHH